MNTGFIVGFPAPNILSPVLNLSPDVTIPSATTTPIGAASSNNIIISGTTTITAFDNFPAGAVRKVTFSGILTLTYNATSLILPSAANITTAANDTAEFESLGGGNWRCNYYTRASGSALVVSATALTLLSTVTAATSSTVDVETTFSSTYDVYCLEISGLTVSNNGATLNIRLKISGSYATGGTDYTYVVQDTNSNAGADTYQGVVSAGADHIILCQVGNNNAATSSSNFRIMIYNPSSTAFCKQIRFIGEYMTSATAMALVNGAGVYTTTAAAMTGIRIYPSAGTILAGKFRLYGIANS